MRQAVRFLIEDEDVHVVWRETGGSVPGLWSPHAVELAHLGVAAEELQRIHVVALIEGHRRMHDQVTEGLRGECLRTVVEVGDSLGSSDRVDRFAVGHHGCVELHLRWHDECIGADAVPCHRRLGLGHRQIEAIVVLLKRAEVGHFLLHCGDDVAMRQQLLAQVVVKVVVVARQEAVHDIVVARLGHTELDACELIGEELATGGVAIEVGLDNESKAAADHAVTVLTLDGSDHTRGSLVLRTRGGHSV